MQMHWPFREMKNLITHLRTSPRPVSGLVQVNAQGMKKNKSMHKITSTARKDKGHFKVTRSCGDTKLTVPPRKPVKTTLLFGGGSSSPSFRHRSCHSLHDLPLAMANGSGWIGDHTAMESSPMGPPDVSRGERAFSELRSSELLQLRPVHTGRVSLWVCMHMWRSWQSWGHTKGTWGLGFCRFCPLQQLGDVSPFLFQLVLWVELCPLKSYVEVLTPMTSHNVTLCASRVVAYVTD